MSAAVFALDQKTRHEVFQSLDDLAKTYSQNGKEAIATPEPLTSEDLSAYALEKGQAYVLKLTAKDGTRHSLTDAGVLALLRDELRPAVLVDEAATDAVPGKMDFTLNLPKADPDFTAIAARYAHSSFEAAISYHGPKRQGGHGTASIHKRIPNGDGTYTYHVLTNHHIADDVGYEERALRLSGLGTDAYGYDNVQLLGSNPQADIAVYIFTSKDKLEPIPFENEAPIPEIGERLLIMGNTEAEGVLPLVVTFEGKAEGFESYSQTDNDNTPYAFYQIRGSMRPGNSGSPVVNDRGNLVGVYHAYNGGWPEQGYMVPVAVVKRVYEEILAGSSGGVRQGDWGFYAVAVPSLDHRRLLLPEDVRETGVLISKVYPGEAADQAGLKAGDYLLSVRDVSGEETVFNIPTESEMPELLELIRQSRPDESYELKVFRPAARPGEQNITLTLKPQTLEFGPDRGYETRYGFNVTDISTYQRRQDPSLTGIAGVSVLARGASWLPVSPSLSSLYEGMVITHVGGQPTPNTVVFRAEFERALAAKSPFKMTVRETLTYMFGDAGPGSEYDIVLVP